MNGNEVAREAAGAIGWLIGCSVVIGIVLGAATVMATWIVYAIVVRP